MNVGLSNGSMIDPRLYNRTPRHYVNAAVRPLWGRGELNPGPVLQMRDPSGVIWGYSFSYYYFAPTGLFLFRPYGAVLFCSDRVVEAG